MRRSRPAIADSLLAAADRLAAGLRETPQRFFSLGGAVARDADARLRLSRYLLRETLAEAETDSACAEDVIALLRRAAEVPDIRDLAADILTLAPRVRRRRSHHCHGQVTRDRRLLMLRSLLSAGGAAPSDGWTLGWAVAYAVSDYDQDHFVFIGPGPERRLRRLAAFVAGDPAYARRHGG